MSTRRTKSTDGECLNEPLGFHATSNAVHKVGWFASDVLKVCGKVPLCKVRCNWAAAGLVYRVKTGNSGLVPVLIVQCWKAQVAFPVCKLHSKQHSLQPSQILISTLLLH